jgi:cytochrome c-type biogenesis protein CcmH
MEEKGKMNDKSWTVVCIIAGLVVAYAVSGPLRHPKQTARVGTPLNNTTVGTDERNEENAENIYASGTIEIAPEAVTAAQKSPVLFVMIKAAETGPPLAVKRIDRPTFPLTFSLSEADSMAGGGFYDGDILVVARLDQDGVAGPKQAGDLEERVQINKNASRDVHLKIGLPSR